MTHEDTRSDLFMCNEFRAAVWCSKKRGKVQSFRGLKAQEKNLLHTLHTDSVYTHTVNYYARLTYFLSLLWPLGV